MREAASRTFCTAGRSSPTRTAIIAITTSSSISENARRTRHRNGFMFNISGFWLDNEVTWTTIPGWARSLQLERRQVVRLRFDGSGQQRPLRVEVALLQPVGSAQAR